MRFGVRVAPFCDPPQQWGGAWRHCSASSASFCCRSSFASLPSCRFKSSSKRSISATDSTLICTSPCPPRSHARGSFSTTSANPLRPGMVVKSARKLPASVLAAVCSAATTAGQRRWMVSVSTKSEPALPAATASTRHAQRWQPASGAEPRQLR
eukprot:1901130-Rhodomonas_salina.2